MKKAGMPPEEAARFESHVALNIISGCNSRCVFCFEGGRERYRTPPKEEVFDLLREVATRVDLVIFMGGEAILRKDIVEIISKASELGLASKIFTNGMGLADRKRLSACVSAGLKGLHISVNAWDRESWTRISNLPDHRYDGFLRGLDNLRAHFLEDEVKLEDANFHVLPFSWNIDKLGRIVAMILDRVFNVRGPDWPETDLPISPNFLFKHFISSQSSLEKRIAMAPSYPAMREHFRSLLKEHGQHALLGFWGVPLCTLPGVEAFSHDLSQMISNMEIYSNFRDQEEVRLMQGTDWLGSPQEVLESCRACSLLPLCFGPMAPFKRGEKPREDFIPSRSERDPVGLLMELGLAGEPAASLVSSRRAIMEELLDSIPPEEPEAAPEVPEKSGPRPADRNELDELLSRRSATQSPLARALDHGLRYLLDNTPVEGCSFEAVTDIPGMNMVVVTFVEPGSREFKVEVEPRKAGARYPASSEKHGLRFKRDLPPDTHSRKLLARYVYHCLIEFEKHGEGQ